MAGQWSLTYYAVYVKNSNTDVNEINAGLVYNLNFMVAMPTEQIPICSTSPP